MIFHITFIRRICYSSDYNICTMTASLLFITTFNDFQKWWTPAWRNCHFLEEDMQLFNIFHRFCSSDGKLFYDIYHILQWYYCAIQMTQNTCISFSAVKWPSWYSVHWSTLCAVVLYHLCLHCFAESENNIQVQSSGATVHTVDVLIWSSKENMNVCKYTPLNTHIVLDF